MRPLVTLSNNGRSPLGKGLHGWTSAPAGGSGLGGHILSIRGAIRAALARSAEIPRERISFMAPDDRFGAVQLNGLYREHDGDSLAVILHGLSGSAASRYSAIAADAAARAGYASLRLSMRGADMTGEDIYHAGLTADIGAVLGDPRLARFRKVVLLGYSFGGNIAIRAALDDVDKRVAGVAAVCPPLDLAAVMNACDSPSRVLYKRAINAGLNRCYAEVEARGRAVTPLEIVAQAKSCSDWNESAIVPRFGFRDVQDYYDRASVIPHLHRLDMPCLVVSCANDPVVPADIVRWALVEAGGPVSIRWTFGGHLAFAPQVDLGVPGAKTGLEEQVFGWLRNACGPV
jgi:uncharacterized protein